jgi:predicted kinase
VVTGTSSAVLLVLNGAPAVGKSTLGRLYADEHPLALVVDIDLIRTHLGRWDEVDESKQIARDLAVELARAHLQSGRDVVVAQYFGLPEFVERLRRLAAETRATFVEVVLTDEAHEIAERFRRRRSDFATTGTKHPEADLSDGAIASEIIEANDRLVRDAVERQVDVVSAAGGPHVAYRLLCEALAARRR